MTSLSGLRRTPLFFRSPPSSRQFTTAAADPKNLLQVYISSSPCPFLNLSIEHDLLQKSHPESTVFFLYINRPCIVIGRNQNPWVEVNLPLLSSLSSSSNDTLATSGTPRLVDHPDAPGFPIDLVRRRSGGGAVFHDSGNINFSVISPSATFDRDLHAHMVVRALGKLQVSGAQVNCRHDIIVADDGVTVEKMEAGTCKAGVPGTYKVSGSAYKLTRLRALHHGTCLLESPNLGRISGLLRSPGRAWIEARGVESVRSLVKNVGVRMGDFERVVLEEFRGMYGGGFEVRRVGEEMAGNEEVVKGMRELKSRDWIYGQTPRFTFSSETKKDHAATHDLAEGDSISFEAVHGELGHVVISGERLSFDKKKLYDISNWAGLLRELGIEDGRAERIGNWTGRVLGSEWTTRDM